MNAYVYQAALLCSDCARRVLLLLADGLPSLLSVDGLFVDGFGHRCTARALTTPALAEQVARAMGIDEGTSDTDRCPDGPHSDGAGEADAPQHCDVCGIFLRNPLTDEGWRYVRETLLAGKGDRNVLAAWSEFYGIAIGRARLDADDFLDALRGYRAAMLWANLLRETPDGIDSADMPPEDCDDLADGANFAPGLRVHSARDVHAFVTEHEVACRAFLELTGGDWSDVGHNLALSRNGHGAGFFDRGAGEVGDKLQREARSMGTESWGIMPTDEGGPRIFLFG